MDDLTVFQERQGPNGFTYLGEIAPPTEISQALDESPRGLPKDASSELRERYMSATYATGVSFVETADGRYVFWRGLDS